MIRALHFHCLEYLIEVALLRLFAISGSVFAILNYTGSAPAASVLTTYLETTWVAALPDPFASSA